MLHIRTVHFNKQDYDEFESIVGNGQVQRNINDLISQFISINSKDVSNIDLRLLDKEIQKLTKEKIKLDCELQAKLNLKKELLSKRDQKEKDLLEAEKIKIKESNSCKECGTLIAGEGKTFNIGSICNQCFFVATEEQYKKWSVSKWVKSVTGCANI